MCCFDQLPVSICGTFPFCRIVSLAEPEFTIIIFETCIPFVPIYQRTCSKQQHTGTNRQTHDGSGTTIKLCRFIQVRSRKFLERSTNCASIQSTISSKGICPRIKFGSFTSASPSKKEHFHKLQSFANNNRQSKTTFILHPFDVSLTHP